MNEFAEYFTFLIRRWVFIAGGSFAAMGVMAAVTAVQPDVFSSWAAIHTGTLGQRHGSQVDRYRDRFNATDGPALIGRLPDGGVTRITMTVAPPYALVRADAREGIAAARAAREAAQLIVAELSAIPVVDPSEPPPSSDEVTTLSIRSSLGELAERVKTELETARTDRDRVVARRQDLIDELGALTTAPNGVPGDRWRRLSRDLVGVAKTAVEQETRLEALELFLDHLERARKGAIPQAAIPFLSQLTTLDLRSASNVEGAADKLLDVLAGATSPPIEPIRISEAPQVADVPAWPRRGANVLIAFVFGLVASTFVALLLERDHPGPRLI